MFEFETIVFADWFPTKSGFVAIRPEFYGTAVYQYRTDKPVKHDWFMQSDIAYALYEELRSYLAV
ncbi:hypothetical protein [Effusibacillus dendaii]|uniref:Uncharacterized protein n=1 Tax=Effusibacillus dendaii TaxID=2743772 RepID=A0A7I8D725_9BACL|nr:hypothetical protein [Effusibacillus dendaii]BCJ85875.1 hypothetical protein skT53_08600 [Effusibacillus dendaii]